MCRGAQREGVGRRTPPRDDRQGGAVGGAGLRGRHGWQPSGEGMPRVAGARPRHSRQPPAASRQMPAASRQPPAASPPASQADGRRAGAERTGGAGGGNAPR